jgi:uncharacterized membrane protein (UPF0136 family)
MLSTEAISAVITGVLVAIVFTLIVFLVAKLERVYRRKAPASLVEKVTVFQALWKGPSFEMARKVAWGILLILFAASLLLTFCNVRVLPSP